VRSLLFGREADHEARSPAGGTIERDPAAVRLGDRAHDGQAEAGTPTSVPPPAHEALEDPSLELLGDARAVVLDDQQRRAAVALGPGAHMGSGWGVAQSVLEQVQRQAM